jgi:2-C-methyl-D-erythritol 4-phosphate cytidylyltransferase
VSHAGVTVLPSLRVTIPRPAILTSSGDVDGVTNDVTSDVTTGDVPRRGPDVVWCIVVAGGSGARFGRAKQYETVGDVRIVDRSVAIAAEVCDGVVVVVPAADVVAESRRFAGTALVVAGGSSRTASVRCGLGVVPHDATVVCVHDAARPFASHDLYARVIRAIEEGADGAIPGVAVTDTIKVIDDRGVVTATPARDTLRAVQTPQAFAASILRRAHVAGGEGTDDAALVEAVGGRVVVVDGDTDNRKITHPDDLDWARGKAESSPATTTGDQA